MTAANASVPTAWPTLYDELSTETHSDARVLTRYE
eukprot:CAMPEP_0115115346 /NCGR_PEP_ID=MMETSP0227-20121206/42625_1 /TAXON_ID=89957 /ORGANISM="Polarella glacialis, Strain CCMP 1383" /LENGTH=34 /DNA_ID= /DNA_START= /DNA_END= /DNA_ORIENTATION=